MKAIQQIGIRKAATYGAMHLVQLFLKLLEPASRRLVLKAFGAQVGQDAIVHDIRFLNLYRTGLPGLSIGDCCFLSDLVIFDMAERVTLGNHVSVGSMTTFLTHLNVGYPEHPLQRHFPPTTGAVTIEDGCFLAAGVTVLPGVTIGRGSFIAVGTVVTRDVPPHSLVTGVPGKVVRTLEEGASTSPE